MIGQQGLETICLAAILKDEDQFVDEWVAYHRLLGIDHFFLYDNDPRQPLAELLAPHRDYVTVRPWLVRHDDKSYPGRTKQLKAYNHCLQHGAANYRWVTFIDGDEFIVLNEHPDIKAFLAEFAEFGAVTLNWHVFGHNGYYDDPPGLIIESLTRRMEAPRPITKSLLRTDAIVSLDTAHRFQLKKDATQVDPNKQLFRSELYPGKTRIAHINHYQCRSFTHWMGRPGRGEAGAFENEPGNEWRFTKDGSLRHFVAEIAVNKNEFVDTSMLRHVEPVKNYLSQLRAGRGIRASAYPPLASRLFRFLSRRLPSNARRIREERAQTVSRAEAATLEKNWSEALHLWKRALSQWQGEAPAVVYWQLGQAYRRRRKLEDAGRFLDLGLVSHPNDPGLLVERTEIAMAQKDWPRASELGAALLGVLEKLDGMADDRALTAASMALMESQDYGRIFSGLQTLKRRGTRSKQLLAIEGITYLRSSQIEAARRHWEDYWTRAKHDRRFADGEVSWRPPVASQPVFEKIEPKDAAVLDKSDGRFCIYTALFGDYDVLHTPAYAPPGLEFICFSDRPRNISGWDVRVVDLGIDDPALCNRRLKILPYDYLGAYDYSLYLDARMYLVGDPLMLYKRWLEGVPFAGWAHSSRACLFHEMEAILARPCHEPNSIIDQYVFLREQGVPNNTPVLEASFLWRDHRDSGVRALMEQLWDYLVHFQSRRDQPGLGYLMWKTGTCPALLPESLGNVRVNEFIQAFPHRQSIIDAYRIQAAAE